MRNLKNKIVGKTIGWTGIISAILFFISAVLLARFDMYLIDNISLRAPDAHVGRVVPFVIKGITIYLTAMQAEMAKGLMAVTFITLGILAFTFWLSEQAAKKEMN